MSTLYLALIATTTLWILGGLVALARVRRRSRLGSLPGPLESVSVLKPLCGADDSLEANLRTFFEQDHDDYELIFGLKGEDDPALEIVRRLRSEYPDLRSRIVVHGGGRGLNPKVDNLRAMMAAVSHDVIVISDSNVAVHRGYLRQAQSELLEAGTGLVTHLIVGAGERSLGAAVEALHMSGSVAGGVAMATEFIKHPAVIGKSMMFRHSLFERLGGFGSVANVLAEDYVVGRMFHEAGYRVRLCAEPILNVGTRTSLRAFFRRQERWAMMRLRLQPLAFLLEPMTIPLFMAALAPLFGVDGRLALAWALGITLLRDGLQWTMLRGSAGLLRALPLFPLRDLLVLAAFASAPFRRHVTWRGKRVRISAGSRLYAEGEPEASDELLVEG
ncbi:MAG: glycosyltransferase [Myxococcales bacterium]|nr:glycosyltransferase [Myxococcales bacterium]